MVILVTPEQMERQGLQVIAVIQEFQDSVAIPVIAVSLDSVVIQDILEQMEIQELQVIAVTQGSQDLVVIQDILGIVEFLDLVGTQVTQE